MTAHNKGKRYIHGRYVSKATYYTYNALMLAALLLAGAMVINLLTAHTRIRASEQLVSPLVEGHDYSQQEDTSKWMRFEPYIATAYTCDPTMTDKQKAMNCPNGVTADGSIPDERVTVACDRSMLGKTVFINGFGTRVCQDTGGAIKGNRIDIYMDTYKEAMQFGEQAVLVAEVE